MNSIQQAFAILVHATILVGGGAQAQDIYGVPGSPRLVPVELGVPNGGTLLGVDDAGFVYYAQGQIFCHHRNEPTTSFMLEEQSFFDANGTRIQAWVSGRLTDDGAAIDVAFVPSGGQGRPTEAVRFLRASCPDLMPGGAGPTALGGTILRSQDALLDNFRSADFVRLTPTRFCLAANPGFDALFPTTGPSSFGIACIDVATTPPTVTRLVDAAELDALLDVQPALSAGPRGQALVHESWTLSALAPARDGRIFFFADRAYRFGEGAGTTHTYRLVVERHGDGRLVAHAGPVAFDSLTWGSLSGAGGLAFSAELDAMVTKVVDQEHNWAAFADIVATGFTGRTWGWTGVGLRVFPLDSPGSGYLPLSQVMAQRHGCDRLIPYCNQLGQVSIVAHDGQLLLTSARLTDNPNLPDFDTFALKIDPAGIDLDEDGLSASEEAGAGTWDTVSDSDGGGTPDAIEVRLAGSDPLDSGDEPARLAGVRGAIMYVPSPLVASRLSDTTIGGNAIRLERPRTVGNLGPVCTGGNCYGPDGAVMATYPLQRHLGGASTVTSADGTFIMLRTAEGLVRFHFADAREELAVAEAQLAAHVPTWSPNDESLSVFPIDGRRTLLVTNGVHEADRYPAVVLLADGDTMTVLYDHAQAQRDSGLTVADDSAFEPNDAGIMASIIPIGWNAETERLNIGVRGNWESWLLAVGLDGSVEVLGRGRALKGLTDIGSIRFDTNLYPPSMPAYLLPTGHGDYFAAGAVMEPFGGFLPARSTLISNMDMPPLAIWGDVLLSAVCCGFDEDGLYELVRYDRSVAPGDVLVLQSYSGAMLRKSGPRGGLVDLWAQPLGDMGDIGGIDIAPDGSMRLCVADRTHDVVWELGPAGADLVPEIVLSTQDVPGIRDCAYDADGTLRVLATGPARVEVREGMFGDWTVAEILANTPAPVELVRTPDGGNEVRVRDGLRGKAWLPDGRVVTMREDDMVLRIDDVPMPLGDFGERLVFQSRNIDYGAAHPARVALGIRADGSVVVAPFDGEERPPYALLGQVSVVSQGNGGYAGPLGVEGHLAHAGLGLTVVPGGLNADPWTGRAPPPSPEPPRRMGEDPETDGTGDSGCGSGGETAGLAFALALVGLHWTRRRRLS